MSIFSDFLCETYYIGSLCEQDSKKYYLIERYSDKVSKRLLDEQADLYKQGKIAFGRLVRKAMAKPNPFLELIKKDGAAKAAYHQPVILGLEHGVTFASEDDE